MQNDMDYANVQMEYLNHRVSTPQWCILPSKTHFIDLSYVVAGSAIYMINGAEHEVRQGDLICIPQGSLREAKAKPDETMEVYCLNFQLLDLRTGEDMVLPFDLITPIGNRPQLVRLFSQIYDTWLLKEQGYLLQTRGYSLLILSELMSILQYEFKISNADPRVRKAVFYITEHYAERITVDQLAQLVKLNPVYFCSLFRASLGITVNQFIRHIRVNRAEMLLEEGVYSVTQVAELCGFSDIYYFSRLFKQEKGVAPSVIAKSKQLAGSNGK